MIVSGYIIIIKVQGCYDYNNYTFIIIDALVPEENPVHVGGVAVISCVLGPPLSTNQQWLINSNQFETLNITGVGIVLGNLQFTNTRLKYNCTTVQCTLTTRTGVQLSSTVGTLLVQGNGSQLLSMYLSSSHYRVVGCCY